MDYFKSIQCSIEYIENHLNENISINGIAAEAHFSVFYFQRLFQSISGFTIQEYIRKRRLSEAAVLLKDTNMSILDIALSFRYNSQEAFTRAFESCFGITPARFRKADRNMILQNKINFLDYEDRIKEEINIGKPDFVHLYKKSIIGYDYKSNLNNDVCFEEITSFYNEFWRNQYSLPKVTSGSDRMIYGIGHEFGPDGSVTFLIGHEAKTPGGLEKITASFDIPEGEYVIFKVLGSFNTIQNTIKYIYGTWLPYSNYTLREEIHIESIDLSNSDFPDKISWMFYLPVE